MNLLDTVSPKSLTSKNQDKMSLLHIFCKYTEKCNDDNFDKVFNFLTNDLNLSFLESDSKGRTPLHYAFSSRNLKLIDLIIEKLGKEKAQKVILQTDKNKNTAIGCF